MKERLAKMSDLKTGDKFSLEWKSAIWVVAHIVHTERAHKLVAQGTHQKVIFDLNKVLKKGFKKDQPVIIYEND